MKCLDKKRIKMKQGETLALNERIMLSLVSTGVSVTILNVCAGKEKWPACRVECLDGSLQCAYKQSCFAPG